MSQATTDSSFLNVKAPESPLVKGAEAPISPISPVAPLEPPQGFVPYAVDLEPPKSDSDFFNERIEKIRQRKAEDFSKRIQEEADKVLGQDIISVTDIQEFSKAMEDLEDLHNIAEETGKYLDEGFEKFLESKYDISAVEAKALADYYDSGKYVPGDIPAVMESARPVVEAARPDPDFIGPMPADPNFIGPMPPEYVGQTFTPVEAARPDLDFIGPMPAEKYVAEAVRPSADFVGPMPATELTAEQYKQASELADAAAQAGQSKEQIKEVVDKAVDETSPAIELGKKVAVTAQAFLAIDNFVDNPTVPNAIIATASTASAVAALATNKAVQTAASSIAGFLTPISTFIAVASIVKYLTHDQDYRRSSAIVKYSDGTLNISEIGGHDGGTANWATAQAEVAKNTFDSLVNDYGFVVDEKTMNTLLGSNSLGKGYLVNNIQYGKRMGGRNGSLGAGELIYSMLRSGALKVSNDTPDGVVSDPVAFIDFISSVQGKAQDDYATYVWANYDGKEDYSRGRGGEQVVAYAAFANKNKAEAFVELENNRHDQKLQYGARGAATFTKTKYTVKYREVSSPGEGQIVSAGYVPMPEEITFVVESKRKGKLYPPIVYTKEEAIARVEKLNSAATAQGPIRNFIKRYDYTEQDGKYYVGSYAEDVRPLHERI